MKLNIVAASLCVLGLISAPAFAEKQDSYNDMQTKTRATHDYKDMGLPLCTVSANEKTMIEMNQNIGRSLPNPCKPGWFDRIRVSGGVNVDMGKWGNRNGNIMGENYQVLSLNDAYVNFDGKVNDWTMVFASISYNTATVAANPAIYNHVGAAEYSAAYSNNIGNAAGGTNTVQVEQAYGRFGNFDVSPVYLQIGKSFQDFSRYEIHPITRSMTQVLSETLATSAKLGFIEQGFNGDIYVFNDPISKIGSSATATNYGLALGYDQNDETFGWDIGGAYLYNMMGVNDVAWSVTNFTGNGYNKRVGGMAFYGDVNYGPFMLSARYTQSVQRFSVDDLTKNGYNNVCFALCGNIGNGAQITPTLNATGAKPWAAGLQAGYGFDVWGKSQNVYLGYQASRETAGLNLPKNRWLAGYGIDIVKDTMLGIEWDHDQQFATGNGGQGNVTNLVSIRAAAKFS
jgi:hypothetical protein